MQQQVFERYLTTAEERQLFATVKKQRADRYARRDLAWMQLLRQTGIRVGTLAGLTVGDAERALADNVLQVRPEIAKRGRGGRVPLTRKARDALRDLLSLRRHLGHAPDDEAPLIMSRKLGHGLSVRGFQDRMQHWRTEAELKVSATPHWFRHTVAKRLIANSQAREPLRVVQGVLLHTSISSTAIYTRPDREELAREMESAL